MSSDATGMGRDGGGGALKTSGRNPGRVDLCIGGLQRRESFRATDGVCRSDLGEKFVERASENAQRYADIEEASRPADWNNWRRDWESKRNMAERRGRREAWAEAIDLLWAFSESEDRVDADALREALTRKSLRAYERARSEQRHSQVWFVFSAHETGFSRAATMVEDVAGLEPYSEQELDTISEQYTRETEVSSTESTGAERESESRERAAKYDMLSNGATLGTVCEYEVDEWTWVIITDLPDRTWGDVFDETDDRADEQVVRFLVLDKLSDSEFARFEDCLGCYEHVVTAREFSDHEGAGNYMRRSDFIEKFRALGPFHPNSSREGHHHVEF